MEEKPLLHIGIDLGTKNSSLSYLNPQTNKIEFLKSDSGKDMIASAVSLARLKFDGVIVGDTVLNETDVEYTLYDSKMLIGKKELIDFPENVLSSWPFTVIYPRRNEPYQRIRMQAMNSARKGERVEEDILYPEEVTGLIVKDMIDRLYQTDIMKTHQLGNVVVCVPV